LSGKKSPWRALVGLLVIIVLGAGALVTGTLTSDAGWTPKLAVDLEGGTQVILTPKNTEGAGAREITADDIGEAINIIRQRVDASGVAEAEISTLGSNNIVVTIPGESDPETLDLIRQSATMRFRPVLMRGAPKAISSSDFETPQSGAQSGAQSGESEQSGEAVQSGESTQSGETAQSGGANMFDGLSSEEIATALVDPTGTGEISDEPETTPSDNSDNAWVTPKVLFDFYTLDCTDAETAVSTRGDDDPKKPFVTCSSDGFEKYVLGPVDVEGRNLTTASAGMIYNQTGQSTGKWGVNLEFDAEGTKAFAEASKRLYDFQTTDPTRNAFAAVLDGLVISAPTMNQPIPDGKAQISGNFNAQSASALASQLSFGSLPLNFDVQNEQQISATLGSEHLEKGILAGIVGLILVVLWMVWQYRGLALVSAGSLIMAAAITYFAITLLSWIMGYRLSLPGVAGLIVAVGITADSFIVYFERIRDEVRDGQHLSDAVESGWKRARRTVMISDAVNLIAAVVLYVLAVGGVQGFAFTLGLTTLIDLLVIFLFTHPVMSLLMRTRFFGEGHKLSGLDPEHLGAKSGATYVGRGRVAYRNGKDSSKASTGKSLAERKREAAANVKESGEGDSK